ncbi:hypothetical protein AB4089_11985 [Arthrobacter sp. 2MCAF15]|uniref:hypothetical protein n=1 Tax=Arthrobacter sp. 2MCAF15 TaxID=3232984 RepID=UPI003F91BAB3
MSGGRGQQTRKKLFAIGLVLVAIVIGGGVWGSGLAASGTPASVVDTTRGGVPAPPPSTARPPADATPPATDPAPAIAGPAPGEPAVPGPATSDLTGRSEAELAASPQLVSAPVALGGAAALQPGVTATVAGIEAVTGEATGPGEIAGPAIRFTVSVRNQSGQTVPLADAFVNVEAGADKLPALQLSGPGATKFPASAAAGATVSAVYVFLVPPDQRDQVHIYLNYQATSPILAFVGAATTSEGKS